MLLRAGELTLPSTSLELTGRRGPVAVEIGIGNGLFIAGLAARQPSWNVVGVERSPASVTRAWRLLRRQGAENARLFLGDARFFIRDVAAPGSLARVYVNFPDPWPRPKHRHKRLLQRPFLELLSTRLAADGLLLFTTDHDGYYHFGLEQARSTGLYEIEPGPPPEETLQTKYARKWASRRRSFFHAALRKTGEAPPVPPSIAKIEPMHHAVLEGPLPAVGTFEKVVHPFRGGHVVLREVYEAAGAEPGLLFLVHVEEHELVQEVLVEARPGRSGIFVGLKRFGEPLYTRGISASVEAVTNWLTERGMTVRHEKF